MHLKMSNIYRKLLMICMENVHEFEKYVHEFKNCLQISQNVHALNCFSEIWKRFKYLKFVRKIMF